MPLINRRAGQKPVPQTPKPAPVAPAAKPVAPAVKPAPVEAPKPVVPAPVTATSFRDLIVPKPGARPNPSRQNPVPVAKKAPAMPSVYTPSAETKANALTWAREVQAVIGPLSNEDEQDLMVFGIRNSEFDRALLLRILLKARASNQ